MIKILDNIGMLVKESFTSLNRGVNLILDSDPLLKMSIRLTFDCSESMLMLARLFCASNAVELLMLTCSTENLFAEIELFLPIPLARTNWHGLKLGVHFLSQGGLKMCLFHLV